MATPAVFQHIDHPGDASVAVLYSRAVGRPVGWLMLPVMVGALVQALQGAPIFPEAFVAAVGALLVASGWTHFQLRNRVVEIRLTGHRIALRTAFDVARDAPVTWEPLLRAKRQRAGLHLYVGDRTLHLDPNDWPAYSRLKTAVRPDDAPEQARVCPY
ncbi:hypothetical protein CRI93_02120 [Longimonas halophila]|uniref:DUF304 domain-containing protein n=1 Tax=Longimonas halophila TaxID=1469170 RepID=A0A2H3P1U8_9BACT|nr:hypothetical protein [Longimonas halophila]PEN09550.1 hypothetical protein CRI93_02120 [Longimonas halophila]